MDNTMMLGMFAACCTTFAFVPQVYHTIKTKDTSGISAGMYSIFTLGSICWLLYGILSHNTPVILANGITSLLAITILTLKLKTPKR